MLKIKDKDFLQYQLDKRKQYKELLKFINTSLDLSITIKKRSLGIQDIFVEKRKIKISPSILENVLNELINQEDKCIDAYLNSCCIENVDENE